jgi:hypothetical protein
MSDLVPEQSFVLWTSLRTLTCRSRTACNGSPWPPRGAAPAESTLTRGTSWASAPAGTSCPTSTTVRTRTAAKTWIPSSLERNQGCQIFRDTNIPKRGKIYQITPKLLNGHKIYQMTLIYSKRPQNLPTCLISMPSKIYPNWDFWFQPWDKHQRAAF